MAKYLLIESRDPFDSADVPHYYELAAGLRKEGNDVTLFLVQNGVLATRAGAHGSDVRRLADAGVTVLADDFSLRERGIGADELGPGVREAPIDALVDLILRPGAKTLWH